MSKQSQRPMFSRVVVLAIALATVAIPWRISAAARSRGKSSREAKQTTPAGTLKVVRLDVKKDSGSALSVSATLNNSEHPTAIIQLALYRLGDYGVREARVPAAAQDLKITLGEHALTGSSLITSKLQSADYELVGLLNGSIYNGSRTFFHINKNGSIGSRVNGHVPVIDTFVDNDSAPAQTVVAPTDFRTAQVYQHTHVTGQNSNDYVPLPLKFSGGTVVRFQVEVWLDATPENNDSSLQVTLYNRSGTTGSYQRNTIVGYILGEAFDGASGKSVLPSDRTSDDWPYYYATNDLTSTGKPLYNGSYSIGVLRPGYYGDSEVFANFDVTNSPSGDPPSQMRKP